MVENPEYLKLMFLSDNTYLIRIEDDKFYGTKDSAERYFREINLNENLYMQKTLTMWSMIHVIAILV